jgi:CheY-like chemotaxis protein
MSQRVVALVDDLIFLSRIREAAARAGLEVSVARATAEVLASVRGGARLVLVDADSTRLPWAEAVRALGADPSVRAVPVVAFLSHVRVDLAERARSAGCGRVLARGAFVRELPVLMASAAPTLTEEPTP